MCETYAAQYSCHWFVCYSQELKDSLEKNELARKKAEKTFARNEDHHLQMIQVGSGAIYWQSLTLLAPVSVLLGLDDIILRLGSAATLD